MPIESVDDQYKTQITCSLHCLQRYYSKTGISEYQGRVSVVTASHRPPPPPTCPSPPLVNAWQRMTPFTAKGR